MSIFTHAKRKFIFIPLLEKKKKITGNLAKSVKKNKTGFPLWNSQIKFESDTDIKVKFINLQKELTLTNRMVYHCGQSHIT